ncbi:MAG: agmatine deiminase family protein, partial [Lachnospiraceae bacterium]|nr:agmatine deiminase family protein [Lachnospiraceae bacterium]
MIIISTPMKDGFFMPAEFSKHEGTIMAFPYRSGSWPYGAKAARKAFCEIILKIAECEKIYVAYEDATEKAAFSALSGKENVELIKIKT